MSAEAQETSGRNLVACLGEVQHLTEGILGVVAQLRSALFGKDLAKEIPGGGDTAKQPSHGVIGDSLAAATEIHSKLVLCREELLAIARRVDGTPAECMAEGDGSS